MTKRKKPSIKKSVKSLANKVRDKELSTVYWIRKKLGIEKKSARKAKDTSGRLKSVQGRKDKRLAKKTKQSQWHKEFYKGAPRNKFKRALWLMQPAQIKKFWFSKHGLKVLGKISLVGLGVIVVLVVSVYAYYRRQLPNPSEINSRLLHQATKFYDRTGKTLLYEVYGEENRTVVPFDQISDHAKNATVAIEDKNFYEHNGISLTGIVRAAFNNAFGNGGTQGGSTITQQFIKNSLLTSERTYERKLKEVILALELERLYTKEEILGFYLNEIPYGGTSYGIEAASLNFFGKKAKDLTIEESAILAALPQAPTYYSPLGENTDELIARAHHIIDLMEEQEYISEEEAEKAKKVDVLANVRRDFKPYRNIKAPHFVLEVQKKLEEKYGPELVAQGGLRVITTVDLEAQKMAEKAVKDNMQFVTSGGFNNAALVAQDPETGQVIAMVGSRDFSYPKFGAFNAATARRQPGSSFKPYEYATLMKDNYGAGSVMYDVRTNFGTGANPYTPRNFDNGYIGANTIRNHLGKSRNIPAIKAMYMAGMDKVIAQIKSMGITTIEDDPSRYGLSLAIGAGEVRLAEHVGGYSTFANGGEYKPQTYVLKITNGRGEVLEEYEDKEGEQVLDEQIAYIISDILRDESARLGTFGASLRYFRIPENQVAIKTGTTNDERDGWLMGYSTNIAAGVWVGHSDNKPSNHSRATSQMTGPMWNQFMTSWHAKHKAENFKRPKGVKTVTLDGHTGRKPDGSTTKKVKDIFPSWFEAEETDDSKTYTIDTVSGKLATNCTPEHTKEKVVAGGIDAEIPPSDPAYSKWSPPVKALAKKLGKSALGSKPTDKDDVHKCSDKDPKISIDVTHDSGRTYTVSANVTQGTHPLKQLEFKLDGEVVTGGVKSISKSGTYTKQITVGSTGDHTFTVLVTDKALYRSQKDKVVTVDYEEDTNFGATGVSGIATNCTLEWNKDSNADSYKVYWDGEESGSADKGEDADKHELIGLTPGNYTWRVESYDGSTKLQESSGPSFTVPGCS